MKKLAVFLLQTLLIASLVFSACDSGAGRETPTKVEDGGNIEMPASEGLLFQSNGDGTCSVVGLGECKDADIVVPHTSPDGDSVTSIGASAFDWCRSLTSITIPDSVTSIGDVAFSNCYLNSITIPDSVTSIGYEAFEYCQRLTNLYISDVAAWCNIDFVSDTSNPMCYAKNLYLNGELATDLVIPSGVTSIGDYAFLGCTGLTSITIPDSVTSIGDYAFRHCTGLTSITMPDSVISIGVSAFENCTGVTSVHVSDLITWCNIQFGDASANPLYYSKSENILYLNGEVVSGNIVLSDGVTSIGNGAFYRCTGLTSITIPDSVTSIGCSAFEGCIGLTSITIPNSVTSIGDYAFWDCELTSITIPDGVTHIGNSTFYCCYDLTSITIPNSVTSIGYQAFWDCYNLSDIYYTGTEEEWASIWIGDNNPYLPRATIHYNWTGEES